MFVHLSDHFWTFDPNGTLWAFCGFLRRFAAHNSKSLEIIELWRVRAGTFCEIKNRQSRPNPQMVIEERQHPKNIWFYFGVGSFSSLTCSVQVIPKGEHFFGLLNPWNPSGSPARQPSQKKGTFPPQKKGRHVTKLANMLENQQSLTWGLAQLKAVCFL